uniref:Cytochrome b n=1 Tax=Babesia rodhaini TaxID=5870 RepID=K7ZSN5_BABRO|nr:cytochrome b [Babesia rodhaini]BAM68232.1 cytochrome b [Babesia rodhaini]BAM68234.1 cytochrome b [Babesia rodhaini]BAM68237.1 cytochrome b [Babesia rodhaini]
MGLNQQCNTLTLLFPMNLVQAHLISYNVPLNINGNWNFGFLLGIALVIQILTGIILASVYIAEIPSAFYSISYIIEEIHNGYLFRYLHSNGVCLFFMLMYFHIAKGMFYSCNYLPMSWYTGIVLLIASFAIGFLGYVLPYGQMSYWGATVIINLFYWIEPLVHLLLGGYSVSGTTLGRFYLLHFVLPFVLLVIIVVHIYYLHLNSSSNPLSNADSYYTTRFSPTLISSDVYLLIGFFCICFIQLSYAPVKLFTGDSDNCILADPLNTPLHIVPEWYLLPFYGTLKLLPTKIAGMVAMLLFLQTLTLLVETRRNAYMLSITNIHRIYSSKRTLMIPLIFIISFIGMFHINSFTLLIGSFALCIYNILSISSTQSNSLRIYISTSK